MTPQDMSALHHAAFDDARAWSADEIASLLDNPYTTALTRPNGFALIRTLAGESDLLTLAVDPAHQRQGIARGILSDWLDRLPGAVEAAFLEVAADNHPARALYAHLRFEMVSTRPKYYARAGTQAVDALVMRRTLTPF